MPFGAFHYTGSIQIKIELINERVVDLGLDDLVFGQLDCRIKMGFNGVNY